MNNSLFWCSKGDLDEILVSVGDKVSEGQALVKYSSSEAQAAYDSASRAVAKADRHINELNQARMKPLQLRLHSYQHQQEAKELQGKLQLQSQEMQFHLLMHN